MTSTALTPSSGDLLGRVRSWTDLDERARKRRAIVALNVRDLDELWDLTLSVLTLYSRSAGKLSPHTRRAYRTALSQFLDGTREYNLLHFTPDQAALWVRSMEQAGRSSSTVNVRVAGARALYRALRWAINSVPVEDGERVPLQIGDPFRDVHPARDTTATWERRSPYSDAAVTALLDVASGSDRLLVLLGAHAGFRVSEMLALRWERIDFRGRRVWIEEGKGNKSAWVSCSRQLMTEFEAQRQVDGFVLPHRTDVWARARLRRLCEQAGVEYLGVHSLRHTCGTRLQRQLKDIHAVARHLRHSGIETTAGYVHWADDSVDVAVNDW